MYKIVFQPQLITIHTMCVLQLQEEVCKKKKEKKNINLVIKFQHFLHFLSFPTLQSELHCVIKDLLHVHAAA